MTATVQKSDMEYRRVFPDDAVCFYIDGDRLLCVRGNFVNLQESCAGYGRSPREAYRDLLNTEEGNGRRDKNNIAIIDQVMIVGLQQ